MIIENIFRFKLTFTDCDTYEEVFERLKEVENHFKTLKSLGVKKVGGAEDDYHHFEIDTEDQKIIKELKDMGFAEPEEEEIE
tara:strand:- start:212 stop:457 length:246 start_codon:yes stop_codon:yes gene_type:complete